MGVVRSAKKNENDEGGNGRGWAGREKTRGGWDVFLIGRAVGWGREEILGGGGLFKKKKFFRHVRFHFLEIFSSLLDFLTHGAVPIIVAVFDEVIQHASHVNVGGNLETSCEMRLACDL